MCNITKESGKERRSEWREWRDLSKTLKNGDWIFSKSHSQGGKGKTNRK